MASLAAVGDAVTLAEPVFSAVNGDVWSVMPVWLKRG